MVCQEGLQGNMQELDKRTMHDILMNLNFTSLDATQEFYSGGDGGGGGVCV